MEDLSDNIALLGKQNPDKWSVLESLVLIAIPEGTPKVRNGSS